LDEFRDYFGDQFLSSDDLNMLFSEIDLDHNGSIEIDELCAYFKKPPFDYYKPLFVCLENSHNAISKALYDTKKTYNQSNFFEKFKIRIYLKEFLGQLESLIHPVSVALDKIERDTESHISSESNRVSDSHSDISSYLPPELEKQINRLSDLVSKLETSSTRIVFQRPEESKQDNYEQVILVSREFKVIEQEKDAFLNLAQNYITSLSEANEIYYTYLKKTGETNFTIYYILKTEEKEKKHYKSQIYKSFTRETLDFLEEPEKFNRIQIPREWFSKSTQ